MLKAIHKHDIEDDTVNNPKLSYAATGKVQLVRFQYMCYTGSTIIFFS